MKNTILGIKINNTNLDSTLKIIFNTLKKFNHNYICCVPAHSIMECYDNPDLLPVFNNSHLNTPDGMAVVWLLKLMGHKEVGRVYGPDLLLALCEQSLSTGYKHFFYGGTPKVLEDLKINLSKKFPGLQIVGSFSPPFRPLDPAEEVQVAEMVKKTKPDIVWVGLGSPKQEQWMYDHVGKIDAPLMIGVGAAFDFLSGHKSQAPRWIQKSGLEWLFRFFHEPKRLFRRYILGYPRFVVLVLIELLKKKRSRS
ncbi:MAG: glycosyltransferase [Anaerolineaceae bacterium]|nr:glycosyltransferase [Anaerolineaceae bacterium]